MAEEAEQLDQALEDARKALLLAYDLCRHVRDGAGLRQEEVVHSQRALVELAAVVDEIRELLDPNPETIRRS